MGASGAPDKIEMHMSGTDKIAIDAINAGRDVSILVRHVRYFKNIAEQGDCAIKRITRPLLNFKSFRVAYSVLARIKLIHMIRKGHFTIDSADRISFADQLSIVAGIIVQFKQVSAFIREFRFDRRHDRARNSTVSRDCLLLFVRRDNGECENEFCKQRNTHF